MANIIKPKRGTSTPTTSDIVDGEVAIDKSAQKLYLNDGGSIKEIGGGGGDAATLDGLDSTSFLRSDAADGKTSGNLTFNDDIKVIFGTGSDFEIYHDPDDARLENSNGDIKFKNTGNYYFFDEDGGETLASFINDGAVNLYYANSKKFETANTGVTITGDITVSGNVDGRDIAGDGQDLDDLITLSGVSANSTNLGTFTGSTIADNETIKGTLQDLEDGVEDKLPLSGGTLTGNVSNTSTGHLQVSVGTTAQRTGSASSGMFRFNSTTSTFEGHNGTQWGSISGGSGTPLRYLHVDGSGSQAVTTSLATVDFDTTVATSDAADFTVGAGGEITVINAGTYSIEYSLDGDQSSGNNRVIVTGVVQVGGTAVTGSECSVYSRNTADGDFTAVGSCIAVLTANAVVRVQVRKNDGNITTSLELGTSALSMFSLSGSGPAGPAGPSDIPQNSQTSAYTLVAGDNGKHINTTTGGVTVPSGVFSAGNVVSIYNDSSSNQTITQSSSVTLRLAGSATTGNRTLAQYGLCSVLCVGSNEFVISGAGLS